MSGTRVRPLLGDLLLYAASTAFAALTAATSTLTSHRAWGTIAWYGYAAATLVVLIQLAAATLARAHERDATTPRGGTTTARGGATTASGCGAAGWLSGVVARAVVTAAAWVATALLPLVVQAASRAAGHSGRAQEEVIVIEHAGQRLVDSGTPYLARSAIAALPADDRLLGYVPYQPAMALFGLPRALLGDGWWTDARLWFALVLAATLASALAVLRPWQPDDTRDTPRTPEPAPATSRAPEPAPATPGQRSATPRTDGLTWAARGGALVRVGQAATVLPLSALTLATGGDDLPVLGLCLLALALAARGRSAGAGIAVGVAGALKLFAWPVAVVLAVLALTRGRRDAARFTVAALGMSLLALVPPALVDGRAVIENIVSFPFGSGLVTSPAQSPLLGRLIATTLPAGRLIALALLGAFALVLAGWLYRRPPTTGAAAAAVCAAGLTGAIVLLPATRFGYLLYSAAYAAAAVALRLGPAVSGQPIAMSTKRDR